MPKLSPSNKDEIVDLFTIKHWSCNMISKKIGFSRCGIKKFLNLAGYDTSKSSARNMTIECLNCGKKITLPTCQGRTHKYCSQKCYYEYIKEFTYIPWRQGQRAGRAMLSPIITKIFGPEQKFVTHHKDGNDTNCKMSNLLAFPDQQNHYSYHRKTKISSILIDGSNF